ncbi:MAG: hypothetical protein HKN26_00900 [Acidimicrobiales bacterium]|nr:hypothetical protein [Acidimicrobiales bacterium]
MAQDPSRRPIGRRAGFTALVVALIAALLHPAPVAAQNGYGISLLADSVLIGSGAEFRAEFSDLGASVSGFPGIYTAEGANIIDRDAHLVGDIAIVSLGHNFPGWDVDVFDASLDAVVDSLLRAGAQKIIWVSLRHPTPENTPPNDYFLTQHFVPFYPNVNAALHRAMNRHPQLTIADWTSLSHGTEFTYDAMHLNREGVAAMLALLRREVTELQTIQPAGSVLRIPVASRAGVPDDARAAAVRVTVDGQRNFARITAYPCDTLRPPTPLLSAHHRSGAVSNLAITELGPRGDLCLHTSDDAQISVDLQGWADGESSIDLDARRLTDAITVSPDRPRTITLPDRLQGAAAVAVNISARGKGATGGVTAHTCGRSPRRPDRFAFTAPISTSEFRLVRPTADGRICLSSTAPATVSVDLQAALPNANQAGLLEPKLLINTTLDATLQRVALSAIPGVPQRASGLELTVQIRNPTTDGSVHIRPCARPAVPSREATYSPGTNRTTKLLVPATGDLCVRATTPTTVAIRATGWIDGGAAGLHLTSPVELWRTRRPSQRLDDIDFGRPRPAPVDDDFTLDRQSLPG